MKWNDLSIGKKLTAGFGIVLVIAAVQSGLAISRLGTVNDKSTEITTDWLPSVRVLGAMSADMANFRLARMKLLLADSDAALTATEAEIATAQAGYDKDRVIYEPTISSDAERKLAVQLDDAWKAYIASTPDMLKLAHAHDNAGVRAALGGPALVAFKAVVAAQQQLVDLNSQGADLASREADEIYARSRVMLIGALCVMVALGAAVAVIVARGLASGAAEAVAAAERIHAGDLSQPVRLRGRDEIGRLLAALDAMQTNLRRIVAGVRENAESVAGASAQIASGNSDLSSRTEEQASALQQTAASMEQLSTTVKHNADNATQGNQLASAASQVAASGGEAVDRIIERMNKISESSRQIADIIGVIDGIAFQTNILALNAAVEAARAGEQGRGFAVVAGEVRTLAQRSAQAAREIKSLISQSVERVDDGTRLVGQAGDTMREVVTSIRRVSDIVGEISSASVEQSAGVQQIEQAVAQMDQATQQNSALVEESAAAAESLKAQALQLLEAVAVFKLAGDAGAPRSERSAPAVAHRPSVGTKQVVRPKPMASATKATPSAKAPSKPLSAPATRPAEAVAAAHGADDWASF